MLKYEDHEDQIPGLISEYRIWFDTHEETEEFVRKMIQDNIDFQNEDHGPYSGLYNRRTK